MSIYTQYSIMTKQKQVCRNFCKTEISHLHKYSDPLLNTLLKHHWQQLQPRVFLGIMLQALHTGIWGVSPILFCRSPQAPQGWMGSVAAQIFSGLWLGHSRIFRDMSWSHSCVVLAGWLGPLSCRKVNLRPSLRSWAGFHQGSLYFAPFIFPSILTSLPVPAAEKYPHSMILPPPCFTLGMVPGFLQTWRLAFRLNSSILVSSD